jgi:hypothetical protein
MTRFIKTAAIIIGAIATLGVAGAASANPWDAHHPRRVEVNHRLAHIDRRIAFERRDGELTRGQARDLRREDAGIRGEERFDASHHRSHLTRTEDRRLNREEDRLNRQVRR